jgi:hypothetical protein
METEVLGGKPSSYFTKKSCLNYFQKSAADISI